MKTDKIISKFVNIKELKQLFQKLLNYEISGMFWKNIRKNSRS